MTMPANSVGTLFANNHYVWYGKVSGKFKSSRGNLTSDRRMKAVTTPLPRELLNFPETLPYQT
jgi:hypothetical protein